ncbi:hypothetical protein PGQ11_013851 [Apiospora arundinis]|uniref:Uncharacterized protein n=1 Tax=Apiospora arundinis TaxID=335852 RepID=A0ABR2HQL0_9PEZI
MYLSTLIYNTSGFQDHVAEMTIRPGYQSGFSVFRDVADRYLVITEVLAGSGTTADPFRRPIYKLQCDLARRIAGDV